jgi:flagellar biosynthesis component FlhA
MTVGDGLMAAIPSLLVPFPAFYHTRASDETLGEDLTGSFFQANPIKMAGAEWPLFH